jgi:hypothetical protein
MKHTETTDIFKNRMDDALDVAFKIADLISHKPIGVSVMALQMSIKAIFACSNQEDRANIAAFIKKCWGDKI